MRYKWNKPHAFVRLAERSTLTLHQIEEKLAEERFVIPAYYRGGYDDHHLIWDEGKSCLIAVPVCSSGFIPTVLPVNYSSPFTEYQLADAELAWLGEEYFSQAEIMQSPLGDDDQIAEICFRIQTQRSWGRPIYSESQPVLSWFLPQRINEDSSDRMLRFLRNYHFNMVMSEIAKEILSQVGELDVESTLMFDVWIPGARRNIPFTFFIERMKIYPPLHQ